jgi:hypothetical protein
MDSTNKFEGEDRLLLLPGGDREISNQVMRQAIWILMIFGLLLG